MSQGCQIFIRGIARHLIGLLSVLAPALTLAQDAVEHCVETSDAAATATSDRIAGLEYSCLRLASGRYVLVAQAGEASRPVVLLIHGLGNNAHRDWKNAYPALAKHFRVVALDLPGFGASDALASGYSFAHLDAALEEIAERLSLSRFDLVGHSLGAAVSLYYADRHPERVNRLVLVDAAGVLLKQVFARQLLEVNSPSGIETFDAVMGMLGQGARSDRVLDLLEDQFDVSTWLMANPTVRSAVLGLPIHADAALGLFEHDFTAAIRNVRAPTTIIWGSEDTITPLRTGQLLAARMHDAQLQIVADAQHMPMLEHPGDFNNVLLKALTGPSVMHRDVNTRGKSQGYVTCKDQTNTTYTGTFDRLILLNCIKVIVEHAQLRQLIVEGAAVVLNRVVIESDDVALRATGGTVTGTAMTVSGRIAILADATRIDLAGVTLRAKKQAVEISSPSRIYFSVSDIDAPDYRGDAHFIWPPAKAGDNVQR
jgi:pimeloyl-ACP methyl ester carboxylesterase